MEALGCVHACGRACGWPASVLASQIADERQCSSQSLNLTRLDSTRLDSIWHGMA